jgi:uncharacterized membrane protein
MKLTKWMSFALIFSLSINAAVLAFVGFRLYNEIGPDHRRAQERLRSVRERSGGEFRVFQRTLPREVRKKLKESVKSRQPDLQQHFDTMKMSREAISELLSKDEVNNVALNAAFTELREAHVAVQTIMQEETILALESLSKEQRLRVVEGLKNREQRRQKKIKRRNDRDQDKKPN